MSILIYILYIYIHNLLHIFANIIIIIYINEGEIEKSELLNFFKGNSEQKDALLMLLGITTINR